MSQTHPSQRALFPTIALLGASAAWGSTFFMIHGLLDRVPVTSFLAIRFAIAALFLIAIAPRAVARLSRTKVRHALILGGLYGAGQIFQTWGLDRTSASVSGFITGLYVVFTALFAAALLGHKLHTRTWIATALAVAGIGVLTLSGFSIGLGELLTLAAAVIYGLHIVGLGAWSTAEDALGMTVIQLAVVAAIATVFALPEGITAPSRFDDWLAVGYMAVVAGGLAMLAQTWAQAHLPTTRSAIIMSTEPVFAAAFAVAFGGETPTARLILGGLLVVAAMQLAEA